VCHSGIDFNPFPFVTGLRPGSAAEMLALQNPAQAIRPGLCVTHIGDDPIAGISLESSTKLMQNAGRPLTLFFRALPSPWATGRPNDTDNKGTLSTFAPAPLGSEPEPAIDQQPHINDALDESVPVAGAIATAAVVDML
jgi:hypothetical protein